MSPDRGRQPATPDPGGSPGRTDLDALAERCRRIRLRILELDQVGGNAHYASAFSLVELLVVLYWRHLALDPDDPGWFGRDRFLLSKGHAAQALYAVLAERGFFPAADLARYTRFGSHLGDHPSTRTPGVEAPTGSLGHGLSVALGQALGLRLQSCGAKVVCVMGDGEQAEGQVWEAAANAAHHEVGNLVAVVDRNGVCSGGTTGPDSKVMSVEPLEEKWAAFGWNVLSLPDGNDLVMVDDMLGQVWAGTSPTGAPTVVVANTTASSGIPWMEGRWEWHLGHLSPGDYEQARRRFASEPATDATDARGGPVPPP